jgi:hypothetical protein
MRELKSHELKGKLTVKWGYTRNGMQKRRRYLSLTPRVNWESMVLRNITGP